MYLSVLRVFYRFWPITVLVVGLYSLTVLLKERVVDPADQVIDYFIASRFWNRGFILFFLMNLGAWIMVAVMINYFIWLVPTHLAQLVKGDQHTFFFHKFLLLTGPVFFMVGRAVVEVSGWHWCNRVDESLDDMFG